MMPTLERVSTGPAGPRQQVHRPVRRHVGPGRARATVVGFRCPNQNANGERFVQAVGQECLNEFVVFGPEHLDHAVAEYAAHYHAERPH